MSEAMAKGIESNTRGPPPMNWKTGETRVGVPLETCRSIGLPIVTELVVAKTGPTGQPRRLLLANHDYESYRQNLPNAAHYQNRSSPDRISMTSQVECHDAALDDWDKPRHILH